MKRLGKFYMTMDAVTGGSAGEVFSHMRFVPYRVEYLAHADRFEYIGTSHLFELLEKNLKVPEYEIQVDEHPDPEVDEIVVTAKIV